MLERTADGWRQTREFDFRDYVTPEVGRVLVALPLRSRGAGKKVRPVVASYCPMLDEPAGRPSARRLRPARPRDRDRACGRTARPRGQAPLPRTLFDHDRVRDGRLLRRADERHRIGLTAFAVLRCSRMSLRAFLRAALYSVRPRHRTSRGPRGGERRRCARPCVRGDRRGRHGNGGGRARARHRARAD